MKNSPTPFALCFVLALAHVTALGQGISPYPNAITDRLVHTKTAMLPPAVNTVFSDPDFLTSMVRVTNPNTDPTHSGAFFLNPTGMASGWSADGQKFYLVREDAVLLAFGFDPSTMAVHSLPGTEAGRGLRIPLRMAATFSFVDPDLIYGTLLKAPLTMATFRLSTGLTSPLLDTTQCGVQPALAPDVNSDDVTVSTDDNRVVISEGGKEYGSHMFVVVYDKRFGCRWYNTQTGQIGGRWGALGQVSNGASYLIRHSQISGSGKYIRISVDGFGYYVWEVASLRVTACPNKGGKLCPGYGAMGYNTWVSAAGAVDEMNTLKRPLGNVTVPKELVAPLPLPHYWGMEKNFAWSNGHFNDKSPVCGNTYSYDGDTSVTQPYDGEMFCMETDGLRSTIWRFAHNRSVWHPCCYYTLPFANTSQDGRFLLFTSSWDDQVGAADTGGPRTDVWIAKLD